MSVITCARCMRKKTRVRCICLQKTQETESTLWTGGASVCQAKAERARTAVNQCSVRSTSPSVTICKVLLNLGVDGHVH